MEIFRLCFAAVDSCRSHKNISVPNVSQRFGSFSQHREKIPPEKVARRCQDKAMSLELLVRDYDGDIRKWSGSEHFRETGKQPFPVIAASQLQLWPSCLILAGPTPRTLPTDWCLTRAFNDRCLRRPGYAEHGLCAATKNNRQHARWTRR